MRRAPPLHRPLQGVSGRGLTSPELSGHVSADLTGPCPQVTPGASVHHTTLGPLQRGKPRSFLGADLSGARTYQDKLISESQRHQIDQHLNENVEHSSAAHRDHRLARLDDSQHAQHDASATMPEYREQSNHQAAAEHHQRQEAESTPTYLYRMSTAPPQDQQDRRLDQQGHATDAQHAHYPVSATSDAPTWYAMPQAAADHDQRQEAESKPTYLDPMSTAPLQDHQGRRVDRPGHANDTMHAHYLASATSSAPACYKPSHVNFAIISDNRATTRGHGRSPWSSPPHLLALLLLNPGLELICVVNDLMKNLSRDLKTLS